MRPGLPPRSARKESDGCARGGGGQRDRLRNGRAQKYAAPSHKGKKNLEDSDVHTSNPCAWEKGGTSRHSQTHREIWSAKMLPQHRIGVDTKNLSVFRYSTDYTREIRKRFHFLLNQGNQTTAATAVL